MVTEMNSVLMIFEAVEDPRTGSRTVHNLAEIITMCLLAVLSGCNRISEIHFLMENHLDRLERFLSLEHGLLSLSQLYKILAMIRPAALQQALVSFHNHLAAEIRPANPAGLDLVAIDGKVLRGADPARRPGDAAGRAQCVLDPVRHRDRTARHPGKDQRDHGDP
jgi:hypothetical protein